MLEDFPETKTQNFAYKPTSWMQDDASCLPFQVFVSFGQTKADSQLSLCFHLRLMGLFTPANLGPCSQVASLGVGTVHY